MPDALKKLAAGACPIVATDVYTALVQVSVVAIDITNPTGVLQSVTVKLNAVDLFVVQMPANGGVSWHGPQVLDIGNKINVVAGNASCSYSISGVEMT